MKKPSAASLKRVTPDNVANLGAERLAAILIEAAEARPELKRRLRMELAAEQGAVHLAPEIDKRLITLSSSRSRVSWRTRATFIAELDGLRILIAERMGALEPAEAAARLWSFIDLAKPLAARVKDKDGELAAVFDRAAADLGDLLGQSDAAAQAPLLVEAVIRNPAGWAEWMHRVLSKAPPGLAAAALDRMAERSAITPGRLGVIRQLADAAGDVDAFRATFSQDALHLPSVAAEIGRRLLAVGRTAEAGALLLEARPTAPKPRAWLGGGKTPEPDFDWETVWIDYLEAAGMGADAQAVRWDSFERTLSSDRARAFIRRLKDFDDVEAETRAFAHVAKHADFHRALGFLMEWPALLEAARMIQARADDIVTVDEDVEAWAARLRTRQPAAANLLLRREAAVAFRRRDYATSDRLTQEADSIVEPDA